MTLTRPTLIDDRPTFKMMLRMDGKVIAGSISIQILHSDNIRIVSIKPSGELKTEDVTKAKSVLDYSPQMFLSNPNMGGLNKMFGIGFFRLTGFKGKDFAEVVFEVINNTKRVTFDFVDKTCSIGDANGANQKVIKDYKFQDKNFILKF